MKEKVNIMNNIKKYINLAKCSLRFLSIQSGKIYKKQLIYLNYDEVNKKGMTGPQRIIYLFPSGGGGAHKVLSSLFIFLSG